jgi:hypothetical protein
MTNTHPRFRPIAFPPCGGTGTVSVSQVSEARAFDFSQGRHQKKRILRPAYSMIDCRRSWAPKRAGSQDDKHTSPLPVFAFRPMRRNDVWARLAFPGSNSSIQTVLPSVRCEATCRLNGPVIQTKHSSLPPKGKPEFHAEWLRDEPCDATTTCPRKTGVWCQLLPGDGEHEIRGLLQHSLL